MPSTSAISVCFMPIRRDGGKCVAIRVRLRAAEPLLDLTVTASGYLVTAELADRQVMHRPAEPGTQLVSVNLSKRGPCRRRSLECLLHKIICQRLVPTCHDAGIPK